MGDNNMKATNNCAVFRDLYPSYINEELEEETKTFIIDHLELCEGCKKWKENYKEEGSFEEDETNPLVQSDEEAKVIKKARIYLTVGIAVVIALSLWMCFWIVS